jgi:toxin ParE1/3/4
MPRIRHTLEVTDDLTGIWRYIAHDNVEAADRQLGRLDEVFQLLALHSGLGERRQTTSYGQLRCFGCGNYLVYYRSIEDGVEIVRVLHAAQDQDANL